MRELGDGAIGWVYHLVLGPIGPSVYLVYIHEDCDRTTHSGSERERERGREIHFYFKPLYIPTEAERETSPKKTIKIITFVTGCFHCATAVSVS